MVIILLGVIGIAVIAWEIVSVRYLFKLQHEAEAAPRPWRLSRALSIALGIILAVAAFWWSYPIQARDGVGRVVGVPFMAAYFDSHGFDYSGPLTLPAMIANAVVWFLAPWLVLATYVRWQRKGRGA
jgi:hypothetical protein